jgi:hypothetical protein
MLTQILVVDGGAIICEGVIDNRGDRFACKGADYPKNALENGRVIETEVPDGFTPSGYTWNGSAVVANVPDPAILAAAKAAFIIKVDADVDAIYRDAIGNRTTEYTLANADAVAFKAAGYTGTVPSSVQSWATAKGWTAQAATDDMLATASDWLGAQVTMRAARLLRKEQARVAADAAALAVVMAAWAAFVVAIRTALGI